MISGMTPIDISRVMLRSVANLSYFVVKIGLLPAGKFQGWISAFMHKEMAPALWEQPFKSTQFAFSFLSLTITITAAIRFEVEELHAV